MTLKSQAICKLCKIVVRVTPTVVFRTCSCGEIDYTAGVTGPVWNAQDVKNIAFIDDDGSEIPSTESSENTTESTQQKTRPSKKEMVEMLKTYVKSYENLPMHALMAPVTHSDLVSTLLLIVSILETDCDDLN